MPIPTAIHRRADDSLSTTNFGIGRSAAAVSVKVGADSATAGGGAAADSSTGDGTRTGREFCCGGSSRNAAVGIRGGSCRMGSAPRVSSRQEALACMLPSAWRKKNPMRAGLKVCGFMTRATCQDSGKKRLWMARSASDRKISLRVWE